MLEKRLKHNRSQKTLLPYIKFHSLEVSVADSRIEVETEYLTP